MRSITSLLACGILAISNAQAATLSLSNQNNSLSLTIYNHNLSLVKDLRSAELDGGRNEVIFDGVAKQIQPETAIIYGSGIKVLEQNYSYNLMSYNNFVRQSLGKTVTAIRTNPQTGENISEKAKIIGYAENKPILQFSYGIEPDFPGRIVFNEIPVGMSNKPTLAAQLESQQSGRKNLQLAYLTGGLSWKTDYVANVVDNNKLNLTAWVTINNESGIDYENAKIQLVAGNVNTVQHAFRPQMKMAGASLGMVADNALYESIEPESLNSYELYTLPNVSTIKDKQTKQIALIEKNDVTYNKEFNLNSPFYFGGYDQNEFEKHHPSITYVVKNTAESNLGVSLPSGTVRFYENDKNGNLQFIGSDVINNTAKEDTLRLDLGDAFNISVSGKVKKINQKELSRLPRNHCFDVKKRKTYEAEITVNNAEKNANTVIFEQNFPEVYTITKESIPSESKNATTRRWKIAVPAESKAVLSFTVDIVQTEGVCN